jgi:hypothetical protein
VKYGKYGKDDEVIEVVSAGANIEDTLPRPSRKEARVKTNKVCPTPRFLRFLAPVLMNKIDNQLVRGGGLRLEPGPCRIPKAMSCDSWKRVSARQSVIDDVGCYDHIDIG